MGHFTTSWSVHRVWVKIKQHHDPLLWMLVWLKIRDTTSCNFKGEHDDQAWLAVGYPIFRQTQVVCFILSACLGLIHTASLVSRKNLSHWQLWACATYHARSLFFGIWYRIPILLVPRDSYLSLSFCLKSWDGRESHVLASTISKERNNFNHVP